MTTPMITSISPSSGPIGGGIPVTIMGSGLSSVVAANNVVFGTVPATNLVSVNDSQVVVTLPPSQSFLTVTISVTII
jgi:hypothetical protein